VPPRGKLIQHVRNKPFSVILLDEIEKAHDSLDRQTIEQIAERELGLWMVSETCA